MIILNERRGKIKKLSYDDDEDDDDDVKKNKIIYSSGESESLFWCGCRGRDASPDGAALLAPLLRFSGSATGCKAVAVVKDVLRDLEKM